MRHVEKLVHARFKKTNLKGKDSVSRFGNAGGWVRYMYRYALPAVSEAYEGLGKSPGKPWPWPWLCGAVYRMPESARALCRMVSLTAAKTSRMFEVSVAWVRLFVRC